ncbi:MAG: hypothetical protein ABEH56_07670 [Salinirussus sp.]
MGQGPRFAPALFVLLLLSGCSTLGTPWDGSRDGSGPTGTLTPVPISSETSDRAGQPAAASPTRTPEPLSAGTDSSSVLARALATHEQVLGNQSFRLVSTRRLVVDGTVVRNETSRRTVAAGGDAYLSTFSRTRADPSSSAVSSAETFYNGSVVAARYWTGEDSRVRYVFERDPVARTGDFTARSLIAAYFRAFAVDLRWYVVDESGAVLGASRLSSPGALPDLPGTSEPRDGALSAEVSRDGVITWVEAEYAVTLPENETGRVVRTVRITGVGTATVGRPGWIDTAAERASAAGGDRPASRAPARFEGQYQNPTVSRTASSMRAAWGR